MGKLFGSERARRLVRAVVKPISGRLGLHLRPYTNDVQGFDPWRDVNVLLGDVTAPTILDVGANHGQSAARFARLWPGAAIHSFEPSPATFQELQRNVAGLAPAVVHTVNAGVGAAPARGVLLENSHADMSSFLAPAEESWGRYHFVGTYEPHHTADGRLAWCDALFMRPGGG